MPDANWTKTNIVLINQVECSCTSKSFCVVSRCRTWKHLSIVEVMFSRKRKGRRRPEALRVGKMGGYEGNGVGVEREERRGGNMSGTYRDAFDFLQTVSVIR